MIGASESNLGNWKDSEEHRSDLGWSQILENVIQYILLATSEPWSNKRVVDVQARNVDVPSEEFSFGHSSPHVEITSNVEILLRDVRLKHTRTVPTKLVKLCKL